MSVKYSQERSHFQHPCDIGSHALNSSYLLVIVYHQTGNKRMGKRKALEPQTNDWLFSCPAPMTAEQIASALHATTQPITEFSARHWQESWRVGNDILHAYGYPESYRYQPGQDVGWDSIRDWMFIKCWEGGELIKNRWENGKFVGELIIVRECRTEISVNLASLVASVQGYAQDVQKQRTASTGKLMVVLAGWILPFLAERIAGHRVAWVVNPLAGNGEDSLSLSR